MAPSRSGGPRDFADAVAVLAAAQLPAAVELDDLPAPVGLAPFAHAIGGAVVGPHAGPDDVDLSGGHDEWRGAFRVVVLVEADLEAEIAEDPLLAEVGWSWLMESLDLRGAH